MPSFLTKSVEQEFLDQRRNIEFKKTPNLMLAVNARMNRGFQNSTGKVIADLIGIDNEDVGKELSVTELHQRYPDIQWSEPLSEGLAKRRTKMTRFYRSVQQTIDEREQGISGTIVGMGAELLTAAMLSPETYVAPIAGRVATSTAARFVMQSTRLRPTGQAFGEFIKSANLKSATWVKRAEALHKQKFLAGAVEDGLITGLISEPLFQSREEILGNPQGAMDYWATVAASAAISGVANSVLGRFVDSVTMSQHIQDRSVELAQMWGRNDPVVDPTFRIIARKESQFLDVLPDTQLPFGFNGRIRVFHKGNSGFTSGIDTTTGDIVVNTANVKGSRGFKNALETPEIITSQKSGKFNFKRSDGKVESLDLPTTKFDENGISFLGKRKRKEPDFPPNESAPGIEFDPAKSGEEFQISFARFKEEIGEFDGLAPEAQAKLEMDAELPEGINLPESLEAFTLGEEQLASLDADQKALIETYSIQLALARKDQEEASKLAKKFVKEKGGRDAAFEFFRNDNDTLSKDENILRNFFREVGIGADDFKSGDLEEIVSRIDKEARRQVFLKTQRIRATSKAISEWGGYAKAGRAEFQGRLDGSLISGGEFFGGQGNNIYRNMERYRNSAAHLLKGALTRNGAEKFLDKYDDNAKKFWREIASFLNGETTNISPQAQGVAETLALILENQRIRLNKHGAGIRKLEGFFLHTVYNRSQIVNNEAAWKNFMLNSDNIDWDRMGISDLEARQGFVNSVFEDIKAGYVNDTAIDLEVHGGRKGQAFARTRSIHFKKGAQVDFNDAFGKGNTAHEIMSQIELRAKAIAITEALGPDFKKVWASVEPLFDKADAVTVKKHWDEITGEANIALNQNVAAFGQAFQDLTNAITLQGSGITIALSDPISQIVGLYSTGMASSLGRSMRMVWDSYWPAIQSIVRNNDTDATRLLKWSILPHDSNLQATRQVLGDTSTIRQNNIPERLSLNVIKYSGAEIFTKISQMSALISTQRSLLKAMRSESLSRNFIDTLNRFDISVKEFRSLGDDVILGDQLSVFNIESESLRRKFQNLLDENMRLGSLQADPRQAAFTRFGTKRGTLAGEVVRAVGMYAPTAVAVHQKMLMRLAVMGGGDARFMQMVRKGRRLEFAMVMGMMLGSATAIVSFKDLLKNREPFWAGDKPLSPQHMARILKVSGIVPLITEAKDIATGGMAGQMARDVFELAETANKGNIWDTVAKAKDFSPFPWTNVGPLDVLTDTLVGMISEEYLRDMTRRQATFLQISGQDELIDF